MKVLHVVIDGELAGGQLVALKLAVGLQERGHEALIVAPAPGEFTALAEGSGVAVRFADTGRLYRLGGLVRLWRLIRRERVDIVHTHAMVASNVLSRTAARLAGRPVVSHLHGHNVFRSNRLATAAYRRLDLLTARWCSRIVAVSDDTRRRLLEQGLPERLVVTVHNGLDPPEREERASLTELGLTDRPVVGCVGRLEPAKGQADLIEAIARLSEPALLLVGRDIGGHRGELERLAERLDVSERVVFAGSRADVLPLLAACAVVVLPSWTEGFPLAPMEAMAVRRPVVATDVGGIRELVVDGETGVIVPPRDSGALAQAIGSLLADGALATRLGEQGYRRLRESFSEARMIERVLAIYEEVLARTA